MSDPQRASAQAAQTPPPAPAQILICRPNVRLGNTVLMTPLVAEIAARFPAAQVDVLTACNDAAAIFAGFPAVRRVLQFPRHGAGQPHRWLAVLLAAARTRYDLIIDPCPQSWTSRFLTRLLRGRVKIGFSTSYKQRGTDIGIPLEQAPPHMGAWPVHLLRAAFGLSSGPQAAVPPLAVRLAPAEQAAGRHALEQLLKDTGTGPVVAIAADATGAKRLPPRWWRALFPQLRARVPTVRLLEIRPPSGVATFPELPGFASPRVREVAALIEATACFVCADSGLMHLGAATRTPTVGLFKVTDPRTYGPYGGLSTAVQVSEDPGDVAARVADILERRAQTSQAARGA